MIDGIPKYPQGWIMRGDDKELYILIGKKWMQLKENTCVNLKELSDEIIESYAEEEHKMPIM